MEVPIIYKAYVSSKIWPYSDRAGLHDALEISMKLSRQETPNSVGGQKNTRLVVVVVVMRMMMMMMMMKHR